MVFAREEDSIYAILGCFLRIVEFIIMLLLCEDIETFRPLQPSSSLLLLRSDNQVRMHPTITLLSLPKHKKISKVMLIVHLFCFLSMTGKCVFFIRNKHLILCCHSIHYY